MHTIDQSKVGRTIAANLNAMRDENHADAGWSIVGRAILDESTLPSTVVLEVRATHPRLLSATVIHVNIYGDPTRGQTNDIAITLLMHMHERLESTICQNA